MKGGKIMSAKELFSQDLVFEENVQTIDELFKNVANRIKKQNLVTKGLTPKSENLIKTP